MLQLILTLLALLGLFTPTADRRLAKFFLRFVPQLSSGSVACYMAGDSELAMFSGKPQGKLGASDITAPQRVLLMGALLSFMSEGEQQPKRGRPDSLQRRIRRAQRAAGCRSGAVAHTLIPVSLRGFFLAARFS